MQLVHVLLIELGSQYTEVLSRRLRELYCKVTKLSLEKGPPAPPRR
ncbi:GMP synthase [glutamine-hydrolyzing], N' fragment [Candidatus Mycoplasma haemominutum 'Birmingham 1']|uniref:GMP synthase [glutamine-hydrolyzing], N n=1 Tax=Candidatus Mycoplasma haematominutum 'Birmingham 1' TaxID=1116213 RepID=G8C369_9MOLU|nr:GMP synthase [glutamine-hydrolyzing], N' fragment [Candidatus Mycoplasma haematominutum 'Birmingham 1']